VTLRSLVFAATATIALRGWAAPCEVSAEGDHLKCVTARAPSPLRISALSAERMAKMRGVTWHEGCPVPLEALSVVEVPYVDPKGEARRGELIVATVQAKQVQSVFVQLFRARFPIARIEPIDAYDGDDERSMAANNTSGFNCRQGPEKGGWSRHAYGDAIDLNPLWNPQVRGDRISPAVARQWADRSVVKPGMNVRDGTAVRAFRAIGWRWGGVWPKPKDYQHFSATGR
jgi:poly-gamma-glutamate synthesis protein (capsule biosynthesis protein)